MPSLNLIYFIALEKSVFICSEQGRFMILGYLFSTQVKEPAIKSTLNEIVVFSIRTKKTIGNRRERLI